MVIIDTAVVAGWRTYGLVIPTASRIRFVRVAAAASTASGSRCGPSSPSQISSKPRSSACWMNSTMRGPVADGNSHTPVSRTTVCED